MPMSRCRDCPEGEDAVTSDSRLDVGPMGDRPLLDTGFARALLSFRTRLAAFGLGSPPSPILAPAPVDGRCQCRKNSSEDR